MGNLTDQAATNLGPLRRDQNQVAGRNECTVTTCKHAAIGSRTLRLIFYQSAIHLVIEVDRHSNTSRTGRTVENLSPPGAAVTRAGSGALEVGRW